MKLRNVLQGVAVLSLVWLSGGGLFAQGTAFTYQGQLSSNGAPANGRYDLSFTVFNADTGGQPGPALTNLAVLVSNGLFSTTLDFGSGPDGSPAWLEIGVRTNGSGGFVALSPRQQVLPTPMAMFANTASNLAGVLPASQVSGSLPATQLSGTLPSDALSGTYSGTLTLTSPANSFSGTFAGDGRNLSNVSGAVPWQTTAGTFVSMTANRGYLATGPYQVTLSLPTTPSVGDVFRVSGGGAGGWKIAQNAGQVLWCNLQGQGQASDAPSLLWHSLAASADGTRLQAVPGGGRIYYSQNAGLNWSQASASTNTYWSGVATSSDGTRSVAVANPGGIYTNSGTAWAQTSAPNTNWISVASSATGARLLAAVGGYSAAAAGKLYLSSDYGATWTPASAPVTNWYSVASSSDGTKLAAAIYGGGIYVSANYGASWSPSAAPNQYWYSLACSADGVKLAAVVQSLGIYVSTNSGASWTQTPAPAANWNSIAASADGIRLVAGSSFNGIWLSLDSGQTWAQLGAPVSLAWYAVACSASGNRIFGATASGSIYSFQPVTTTGTSGYLGGSLGSAVELQYIGNGQFISLSHDGNLQPN